MERITPKIKMVHNNKGGLSIEHMADVVEPDSLLETGKECSVNYH